ncbi:unnamed protein product [marine sediment metagenome]|uniref:Uncharacterized protein n=1 Tax=marine sediment metagenome TaxID=412755 RepID=X1TAM2_9ZZZZ
MPADKAESIVQCLETKEKSCQATLLEKQTPLLISAGLVKGTTLILGRRLLSRGIQVGVSFAPDGNAVDLQKRDYLF